MEAGNAALVGAMPETRQLPPEYGNAGAVQGDAEVKAGRAEGCRRLVAGTFKGERRKACDVTGRDVVTLDLDNIPAGQTESILQRLESLGVGYCVYSTRKHSPDAPRLRVLLPLSRTVTADEYEPIARKCGEFLGLDYCDKTTFEASRMMYFPSCCADSQIVYNSADKGSRMRTGCWRCIPTGAM